MNLRKNTIDLGGLAAPRRRPQQRDGLLSSAIAILFAAIFCAVTHAQFANDHDAKTTVAGPETPTPVAVESVAAVYWGEDGSFEKAVRGAVQKIDEDGSRIQIKWIDAKSATELPEEIAAILLIGTPNIEDAKRDTHKIPISWLDRVRAGKLAIVGVCGAIAAFPESSEWHALFGAAVAAQPWTDSGPPVFLKSEDALHPACVPFGAEWLMLAPLYQFGPPYDAKRLHILHRINPETTDLSVPGATRPDKDYAVSWAHFFGKGRVFYTALGCTAETWTEEAFQKHLAGGLGWALGQYPASRPLPPYENRAYQTTKNGVRYYDIRVGDGAMPKNYSRVTVDFVGQMGNGTEFTNSYRANQPYTFQIGLAEVVRGLEEGIMSMRVGGKRVLEIPPELGYGTRGWEEIPPNTLLIFEVELVKVE